MSSDPHQPREQPPADARITDPPPRVGSRGSWRAWGVRLVLGVILLVAVFAIGTWYGRSRAEHDQPAGAATQPAEAGADILYWSCSMHPQIKLPKEGQCPICFMDLTPVRAGGGDDPGAAKLTLSARARELARIETAPVERREVTQQVRMVGRITADETRITQVSSYIPGRIERLFVNYTGILVRKGDHLAEIYSPDLLVAQREYLLALDMLEQARQRQGSEAAVQSATALLDASRRKLELWGISKDVLETLARERQPSDHIRIDSPLEGWVLERQGYQGMYVETGTRLFTLADLRLVWVLLDAYEMDIGLVRLGQQVQFETEAYPGQMFQGTVSYIDPVLNPGTRTVRVRVNVENPEMKLRPEMFVRAELNVPIGEGGQVVHTALAGKWLCYMHPEVVKDGPGTCDVCGMDLVTAESLGVVSTPEGTAKPLVIPQSAVLLTGTRAVVYVEHAGGEGVTYEGRTVQLGRRAGGYYVVLDGLKEGERVATRGALLIDSAMQIQARPSMMQPPESETQPAEQPLQIVSHYVEGAMYHQHVRPVIDAYLELTRVLAAGDAEASTTALNRLRAAFQGAEPHGLEGAAAEVFRQQMDALKASLPAEGADIETIRTKLPGMTRALETYLRTFGHNREAPVAKVFCPMAFNDKGAAWLQAEADRVANAYFAKKMLRCGDFVATIAKDGSEQKPE